MQWNGFNIVGGFNFIFSDNPYNGMQLSEI